MITLQTFGSILINIFSIKLFFFLLITTSFSIGQTNQEIKKLVKSAKASGFTNDQIINKAKSSGITDEQINAKKSEIYSNQKTPMFQYLIKICL